MLIFVVWPQLDYWWAGQFYRAGEEFYYETCRRCSGFAEASPGCNGRSCWLYLGRLFGVARPPGHIARRRVYFLLVLLLLGPGLLNELVEENSGRERPDDTFMFAGDSKHQDFLILGQLQDQLFFVSGHAALGFWFIGFAWALVDGVTCG